MTEDCSQNSDPLKLVREGTSQDDRISAAPDPATVPVDTRDVADNIVFAQAYARLLRRYDKTNTSVGDWSALFATDPAAPLALASTEDIEVYKAAVRGWFDFLNDSTNAPDALKDRLGYLYAAIGGLARALDGLKTTLPVNLPLRGTIQNLIATQLKPAFKQLVRYYNGGTILGVVDAVAPSPALQILHSPVGSLADVLNAGLSGDWSDNVPWPTYLGTIGDDQSVYGTEIATFARINHCATHNLFRSLFDLFLKAFTSVLSGAQAAFAATLQDPSHPPHYALYLAFLQLLEHARATGNTLTQRHLDFYYRTILGLKERPSQPGHAHLLAELAKQATSYDFAPGMLFKAGKDSGSKNAYFAGVADVIANKAQVTALMSVYRHGTGAVAGAQDQGRIFASPVANSDDGQGAPLTSPDQSWQPFFNKVYADDGTLTEIKMPEAQIGFAVASHDLLLAEGTRTITLTVTASGAAAAAIGRDFAADVTCSLTTAKGWLQKSPTSCVVGAGTLTLVVALSGADDGIVAYSSKLHGYSFDTVLPVLLVTLQQNDQRPYVYALLQGIQITSIDLTVDVASVKTLVAANDFGPVDLSKPFQPFGASPVAGSSLSIGSKEIFQKQLTRAVIDLTWQIAPKVYPPGASVPNAIVDVLTNGRWSRSAGTSSKSIAPDPAIGIVIEYEILGQQTQPTPVFIDTPPRTQFALAGDALTGPVLDVPDFTADEPYGTASRQGFVRLRLDGGIGQDGYQDALIAYLSDTSNPKVKPNPGAKPPQGPVAAALTMDYSAASTLVLNSTLEAAFEARPWQFFHLAPFGTAEQHPYLSGTSSVPLLPQFPSEGELYIGVSALVPPQTLSLLFQVADGTANPLAVKPKPHLAWSYLSANRWVDFAENAVTDTSGEWLNSGIVTLAVPSDASSDNRLLPSGMIWIRAVVATATDAVCRLRRVAAQALEAVFQDQGNAPDFSSTPLAPGTISQLAKPDAAVKGMTQPFASFGGRGAERPADFYRRISERLRHKDRAIDLWDYERLVLGAFPQIYKVKCLNHTWYEPADSEGGSGPCSGGTYRELAPGHVTLVTLPDLRTVQPPDPLRPYTSLGLLQQIKSYLDARTSCFVQLHVMNPQFEAVRVAFKLKLRDGYDQSYYTTQLLQAIMRFLSPWAFGGAGMPSFGGRIYKSVLINFVEQQPYVDYVTDFKLFQDIPCEPPGTIDLDEVTGSRAISILVSAPASKHLIAPFVAAPDPALAESCGCAP